MLMKSSGVSGLEETHRDSWLKNAHLTAPNIVGALGVIVLLALLLIPPLPWSIRLPLYLGVLVWTILRPRTALYLMPLCVPWGSLDYVDVSALRLNSADILVIFLALGWLISCGLPDYLRDREASRAPKYLIATMLALLVAMFLSTKVAINVKDSLKEISKWLEVLAILLLGSQYLRTRRQIWTIIVLVLVAGISQAIYGYLQASLNLGPQSFIRGDTLRVYGTFDQPNPYAGYINMPLSIAFALMVLGANWLTRILAGITTAMLFAAEYLSQSRGGEIAFAAAVGFIILIGMPRIRVLMRLGIIALLGAVEALLLGLIPLSLFNPLLKFLGLIQISLVEPNTQDFSTAERLAHWIAGLRMYFDHPLLGVGIGNYQDAYPPYHIGMFVDPLGHAHNYYINIAAETGTVGLIAYLLFILALFVAGGRVIYNISLKRRSALAQPQIEQQVVQPPLERKQKLSLLLQPQRMINAPQQSLASRLPTLLTNDRALAIGLCAALLTVSIHSFVDDVYVHSLTNLIALLLILLIRLERVTPDVSP